MTTEDMTTDQINALRREAIEHGDHATVACCATALGEPLPDYLDDWVDRPEVSHWLPGGGGHGDTAHARQCIAGHLADVQAEAEYEAMVEGDR